MGVALKIFYSHRKTKETCFFLSTRNLCFGRLSCSKYLLGTTGNNLLCCWNLLTCSCKAKTSTSQLNAYVSLVHAHKRSFLFPVWQWSGALRWTSVCCWLTRSLRTWLPSAVRLEAQTVSFNLGLLWKFKGKPNSQEECC